MKNTKKNISIDKLHPFKNHPYKVQDNEEMERLAESIKQNGVVSPIIVHPMEDMPNEYEIISGHRRVMASRKAGMKEVPVLVVSLDRDAAAIVLVDSNLHREHILPSEKAFAYKLKSEALAHQGWRSDLTSCQLGTKLSTDEQVAVDTNDSARQVRRYIRITNLIPEILQYVDDGKIAFTPAVELSFLPSEEQHEVYGFYENEEVTPSYSQTVRMKKLYSEGMLTSDKISDIMAEAKANQKDFLKIPTENINKYFKSRFTEKQKQEFVIKAVEHYHRFLMRQRDAG